jgi:hypothetical protein
MRPDVNCTELPAFASMHCTVVPPRDEFAGSPFASTGVNASGLLLRKML